MADQFIGQVLAEKYRIDSLLSEGTLGNIYHGTHLLMDKPVSLKILPPSLSIDETIVKKFSDEARTVSRISHPNILSVTDYGSENDVVFIVYEDADGETLKEFINRRGKLSLKLANKIVQEVASVLSFAHSNGIIHQNLSSDNILIQPSSNKASGIGIKVLNFGTSTFDINDLDYPIEKIQYLAPEQCVVSSKIDNRTDIYSLGVILFEMLTGEVPFTADNGTDLLIKQTQEPPPPINAFRPDLPNEVDEILLTTLAKNPEIRYQKVEEFADELNQVSLLAEDTDEEETIVINRLAEIPVGAATASATPAQNENNLWKTAFIVLAGVVLLGGSFIYMTSGKQTNPATELQIDANGMPVQPAPPPSGTMEQTLANMDSYSPQLYGNSNIGVVPEGGASNPYWESGKRPPGMPTGTGGGYYDQPYPVQQVAPGGETVYMDPSNGSIFMPKDDGSYVIMQPKQASNTASNVNTAPRRNSNTNTTTVPANTAPKTTQTPTVDKTPEVKPTVAPKTTPSTENKPKPEPNKPAAEKQSDSGKTRDAN